MSGYIDAFVFTADPAMAAACVDAGAAGIVIDWERRGKRERQTGFDTEVNHDTPAQLAAVRAATAGRVLCRVEGWGDASTAQLLLAAELGADEILLPMVRTTDDVDRALDVLGGRCRLGILVETADAVAIAAELLRRPISRVYVGLNDLCIDRRGHHLFEALVDGTVDDVRAACPPGLPFGVAGLTLPERGHPVPSELLAGELARLDASFTFLRRSFHADVAGRDLRVELPRVAGAVGVARQRTDAEVAADHARLAGIIASLVPLAAVPA